MTSKTEKDKAKQIQDKCQALLNEMLRDEDNKYCVDCDSKGPRWASWNLGVFLCIRCAGIHRNLGVHISKVKSVNLDTWTPEQVVSLQQMGNSRARAVYEANLPDNFRRPQSDSSLESFVRAKYEHKKYIAREWVPPVIPKVDWEKEIDEEIERQKRKKKAASAASSAASAIDKKPIKIAEVPQIPKPKNASPKPARITVEKTTQDLLGLQNGEDGFTGFLSGPAPIREDPAKIKKKPEENVSAEAAAKAEEESFFNQPAPTEKERTKLTKDSILALYGSAPQSQPQQVMYSVPQCASFPQQVYATSAFGAFPQQQQQHQAFPPVQNGMASQFHPQQPSTAAQFQQFPAQGQYGAPMQPAGQYMVQSGPTAHHQFAASAVSTQFPGLATAGAFGAPQPQAAVAGGIASNPFFGGQSGSLQQQFAGMALGGHMQTPKSGSAVATNLWQ
ncbi:uncharacterized protein CBL_08706 [Carabus blaptoides fortunei]